MAEKQSILIPGQQIKAILTLDEAKQLVELRYGLKVTKIYELDAYDDRNYRVLCEEHVDLHDSDAVQVSKHGYVFKIINSLDSQKISFIDAQNELLLFLGKKGVIGPIPVKQKNGSYYSTEIIGENESKHALRLLIYQPGEVLDSLSPTLELLKSVGSFAARLDKVLEEFSHPAYEAQTSLWVLPAVPKLRQFLFALDDKKEIDLIESIISDFEQKVLSISDNIDKGIIHGDLNENNIIVNSDGKSVAAIIDFGDSHRSCFIFELAICLCYMITKSGSLEMAKPVIEGYQMHRKLTDAEKRILKLCVCARLAQSLVLGVYSFKREPNNQYLIRAHPTKWSLLKKLWPMRDHEVMDKWGIGS